MDLPQPLALADRAGAALALLVEDARGGFDWMVNGEGGEVKSKPTGCTCKECQSMCENRPCWPTPEESKAIIDAGLGHRMMRDYWADTPNIDIIAPALVGYENQEAPFFPTGRCTFLTAKGRCELHQRGLKPREGREAWCKKHGGTPDGLHEEVARTWENEAAQNIVLEWIGNKP